MNTKKNGKTNAKDQNFQPKVREICSIKSVSIEGRAGKRKSTLMKTLHTDMDKINTKSIPMAPTNRACRRIQGKTVHNCIASLNMKSVTEHK